MTIGITVIRITLIGITVIGMALITIPVPTGMGTTSLLAHIGVTITRPPMHPLTGTLHIQATTILIIFIRATASAMPGPGSPSGSDAERTSPQGELKSLGPLGFLSGGPTSSSHEME